MNFILNRKAFERLKALIRSGHYTPGAFSFSARDGNALLGDQLDNWTEYAAWFLGIDPAATAGGEAADANRSKSDYAYPIGRNATVYLEALQQIVKAAIRAGDSAIGAAALECLKMAADRDADAAQAARTPSRISASRKIQFTKPVAVRAAATDDAGNVKGPPTFDIVAYTGAPMVLEGWEHPVVVELSGMEITEKSRPALRDHDPCRIVGHTTSVAVQAYQLLIAGLVSGSGPDAAEVVANAKKQFPWQASIGASVIENQFIPKGQQGQANGQTLDGPVNIARRTSLDEISFVALGADDDTSARIAAKAAKDSPMDFDAWLAAKGFNTKDLTVEQAKAMKAAYDAETDATARAAAAAEHEDEDDEDENDEDEEENDDDAPPAKKGKAQGRRTASGRRIQARRNGQGGHARTDPVADDRNRIAAERKRLAVITAALESYRPRVDAARFAEIESKAIVEGWDADKTELSLIRAARPDAPLKNFYANTQSAEGQVTPDILAAACAVSGGVSEKYAFKDLNDKQKEIAASKPMRHQTIFGMCSVIAAANGMALTQHKMDADVIRAMFEIDRKPRQIRADGGGGAGGFSTMSLSGLTENILNKAMLKAYGVVASVVDEICYQTDTNDFKQFKRYRMTASGSFALVGPTGELENMSLQDESYPNQVSTWGALINVTRQILINDDMGGLTDLPTIIGKQAAISREKAVFTTYAGLKSLVATGASVNQAANAFNFISTGAKNYLTGAGSALTIAAMATARQRFVEQKDANGDPIMVPPDRVLVPPALETTADNLFQGANIVVGALGATNAKSTEPNLNAHRNKYRPIVTPFLGSNSSIAGLTDTQWSLHCNPGDGEAAIQIGYLRGQRAPVIERGEGNFNTLGISMRAFYDFGVAAHDWRTIIWNDGQ